MSLDDLYQEIILEHYRRPRNSRPLDDVVARVHENPACGDAIKLLVEVDDNGQVGLAFDGKGCAISISSASMMTELVKGRTVGEAEALIDRFVRAMRGEIPSEVLDELGELASLKGVRKYPVRVKCATLAWHALAEMLRNGFRPSGNQVG